MRNDIVYYIWLAQKFSFPSAVVPRLIADFGGAKGVFEASEGDLKALGYLKAAEILKLSQKNRDSAERIIEDCCMNNIDVMCIDDETYPEKLKNIYNPPTVLYTKGTLANTDATLSIAVVGARNPLDVSISVADSLTRDLARLGVTIISGLAEGIDATAHKAALQAGGKTVALLPCGLDRIYPREHEGLAEYICANGGLVSEYPPKTRVFKSNFSFRNRIISGLSDGVLIVEAGEKSGTSITAKHAAEQNRDVFVVPGDVYRYSYSNSLIKLGAKPVTEVLDIIEEYQYTHLEKIRPAEKKPKSKSIDSVPVNLSSEKRVVTEKDLKLDGQESVILSAFGAGEKLSVDDVAARTGIPVNAVIVALTMLTVKGFLKVHDGNNYSIA